MAVAFDVQTESHTGSTGSASEASFSWSHNPVGVPKGILVFVFTFVNAADVSSVTYDGTTVPAVTGGEAIDTAGEPGRCKAFFLGASVPTTDPATVVVNRTNNTDVMYAISVSVTAATDTEVTGVALEQEDQALTEENVDDGSPGSNSVRFAAVYSGSASPPTTGSSSTTMNSITLASQTGKAVRETTAGQGSRPVGFTVVGVDDVAAVYLAVRQLVVAAASVGTIPLGF